MPENIPILFRQNAEVHSSCEDEHKHDAGNDAELFQKQTEKIMIYYDQTKDDMKIARELQCQFEADYLHDYKRTLIQSKKDTKYAHQLQHQFEVEGNDIAVQIKTDEELARKLANSL